LPSDRSGRVGGFARESWLALEEHGHMLRLEGY